MVDSYSANSLSKLVQNSSVHRHDVGWLSARAKRISFWKGFVINAVGYFLKLLGGQFVQCQFVLLLILLQKYGPITVAIIDITFQTENSYKARLCLKGLGILTGFFELRDLLVCGYGPNRSLPVSQIGVCSSSRIWAPEPVGSK